MRRTRLFVHLAVLGALVVALGLAASLARAQGKPIRIGIPQAMTGPVAFAGVTTVRAAQIAVDEINAKGGINGRKLELVPRDDEHNPTKHVAAVRELVEKEGVSVLFGPTASTAGLAVAPILNDELHVPMILPHAAATDIVWNKAWREKKPNYMFRYGMFDAGQARSLVEFATKKLNKTKLGIIVENSGWGEGGRAEMTNALKEMKLTPVAEEKFNFKDTDLTPQLGRAQRAGAEVILFYGQVAEATAMMRSAAKMGYRPPVVSAWGIATCSSGTTPRSWPRACTCSAPRRRTAPSPRPGRRSWKSSRSGTARAASAPSRVRSTATTSSS
jgi:branched-chain amino acid transport system substrate-binding protein